MWQLFHFCDILHSVHFTHIFKWFLLCKMQEWECVLALPITDILLRMLLKSRMARSVYVTTLPSSSVVTVPGVRERNTKPKLRAAVTNAPSSGDWALYTSSPLGSERQRDNKQGGHHERGQIMRSNNHITIQNCSTLTILKSTASLFNLI